MCANSKQLEASVNSKQLQAFFAQPSSVWHAPWSQGTIALGRGVWDQSGREGGSVGGNAERVSSARVGGLESGGHGGLGDGAGGAAGWGGENAAYTHRCVRMHVYEYVY